MDAPSEYNEFIVTIKDRIRNAQYEALKAVNKELVGLYWDIGKMIFKKQKELGWGKSVVENIAKDLRNEFPHQRGFSARNIWLMVNFYVEYKDDTILQSLTAEISFTSNVLIFTKCKERDKRQFYLVATKKYGWTTRVLEHQVENKTYDKYKLGQANFKDLPPEKQTNCRIFSYENP